MPGPTSLIAVRDELPAPRLAHTQRLWLPGDFPSTNEMLELARAEGFSRGLRHYERSKGKRQTPIHRPHANRIASIRAHAAAHARKYLEPIPAERWVRLAFFLIGHPRYDADAWYLSAKPIADGLQDAGVIGNDAADVHSTEGRCVKSAEEAAALAGAERVGARWGGGPGMLVEVSPWG